MLKLKINLNERYPPTIWICPKCNCVGNYYTRSQKKCIMCDTILPDMIKLTKNIEERVKYHTRI